MVKTREHTTKGCEGADRCTTEGFCFAREQGKKRGDTEWWGVELKLARVEEGSKRSIRPSRQRGQRGQRPCGSWAVGAGVTEQSERRGNQGQQGDRRQRERARVMSCHLESLNRSVLDQVGLWTCMQGIVLMTVIDVGYPGHCGWHHLGRR